MVSHQCHQREHPQQNCLNCHQRCSFSTSSSTRLYLGRAARLMSDNFYMLPHTRQLGDHDFCLSQSHYTETDPTSIGSRRPQRGSNLGPPHQESRALLARAGQLPQPQMTTKSGLTNALKVRK